ncbi:MAG: gamma-glutamyl-gamma-aminobutyrate hydrolase family protein [Thermoleophilaceae bacterium]
MRLPLIGVTTSEVRIPDHVEQTPEGEPPRREMALGLRYLAAIEAAGGLPVVTPPLEVDAVPALAEHISGLLLSGGPDIDPGTYGGRYHPRLGPTEPALDRFEVALTKEALERRMPILAICRGAQLLNVALGGDLYQHLPDDPGGGIDHRQHTAADPAAVHEVSVARGSVLARALGSDGDARVNSFHHQAAHDLGRGLRAVAWAPDGIVEGVELAERDFVVGVQWHAESLTERREQAALFSEFVSAARRYDASAGRSRRAA